MRTCVHGYTCFLWLVLVPIKMYNNICNCYLLVFLEEHLFSSVAFYLVHPSIAHYLPSNQYLVGCCLLQNAHTLLHWVVNPKVTSAQKPQQILSFVTDIRSPIGFLKSFTVGKHPYQHAKTVISPLCNVKSKKQHLKFRWWPR